MKYLIAASDRFQACPDPFNSNRICFKSNQDFFERLDLTKILEDPNFLFIKDSIVYFKP